MNPSAFDVDLSDLDEESRQEFYQEATLMAEAAIQARNLEIAGIGARNRRDRRSLDGVGGMTSGLHPFDYFSQPILQGADRQDPDFWNWFLKREEGEYAKVKSGGTRIQVGFTGVSAGVQKRFHKSYG